MLFSRRFYLSYFTTYLHRKIGAHIKWAARHRLHKLAPKLSVLLVMRELYSKFFLRICNTTRLAFVLRNQLHTRLCFRLLQFYATSTLRRLVFSGLTGITGNTMPNRRPESVVFALQHRTRAMLTRRKRKVIRRR